MTKARTGLIVLYALLTLAGLALAGFAIFGGFDRAARSAMGLGVVMIVGANIKVMRSLGWVRPPQPKKPRRPGEFAD